MLIGDKREFNTALIVPEYDLVRDARPELGSVSREDLAMNNDVRGLISKEIDTLQNGLASFERVRRFALLAEPFTVENELMTPTLKIKRKSVESRYSELIESLYRDFRKSN